MASPCSQLQGSVYISEVSRGSVTGNRIALTFFLLPVCPCVSIADSQELLVLALKCFPSRSSHVSAKRTQKVQIYAKIGKYYVGTTKQNSVITCSKVSCLEIVSFSSFLIFFISLFTWNSCSCSKCCSSSAFSCCNWARHGENRLKTAKTMKIVCARLKLLKPHFSPYYYYWKGQE